MAALTEWKPVHDAHAIQRVVLQVHFSQQITDIPLKKVSAAARDAAKRIGLRIESPIQEFQVAVDPVTGSSSRSVPKVVAFEFVRHEAPNLIGEKATIKRAEITFESMTYTRWQAFTDRAMGFVAAVLDTYLSVVPLRSVALEYFDRFDADEGIVSPKCSLLIRSDSPYIAPKAFSETAPWHSRAGWFDSPTAQLRRLINIDVQIADATVAPHTTRRVAQIRSMMREIFNQPGFESLENDQVDAELLASRFNSIHLDLNDLLGKVITSEAAQRIALGKVE